MRLEAKYCAQTGDVIKPGQSYAMTASGDVWSMKAYRKTSEQERRELGLEVVRAEKHDHKPPRRSPRSSAAVLLRTSPEVREPGRRLPVFMALLLFAVAGGALAYIYMQNTDAVYPRVGVMSQPDHVRLVRDGEEQPATHGRQLAPGDRVLTAGGSVALEYKDRTRLELRGRGELEVSKSRRSEERRVHVKQGQVRAEVPKESGASLHVDTPHAAATSKDGAFDLEVRLEATNVSVEKGELEFEADAGEKRTVSEGQGDTTGEPRITGFNLLNAEADTIVGPLMDGDIVSLADVGTDSISVMADVSDATVVVVFRRQDGSRQTEEVRPFVAFGDSDGDFYDWRPEPGTYTIRATPRSPAGTEGPEAQVSFTVTE
jgi:ferric-dicitrate binding protein FerR (iron transport regulator)